MSGFDYKSIDVEKTTLPKMYKNSEKYFEEGVQPVEVEGLELGDLLDDNKKTDFEEKDINSHGEGIPRVNRIGEPVESHFDADATHINVVDKGDFMGIDGDYDEVMDVFGGQLDNHNNGAGDYNAQPSECDDYAKAYAVYLQTGIIPPRADAGIAPDGMKEIYFEAPDRREQAKYAFDMIKKEGRPCLIHVNSVEGASDQGHWLTVVGYKKGVTKENVTIGDLIVIDPAGNPDGPISAKLRPVSEVPSYCLEGLDRCSVEPGYQVASYIEDYN